MAERMRALHAHRRVRERAEAKGEPAIPSSRLDRASKYVFLRFVRGELPPAPHVLAAAHRGLGCPSAVARLVDAHRRGAPLGRLVDKRIDDPLAVIADPAFDASSSASAEEMAALAKIAQKLDIAMKSTREGHERLAEIRRDQNWVGNASEYAETVGELFAAGYATVRGRQRNTHESVWVNMPPLSMWSPVAYGIDATLDALLANQPGVARHLLIAATETFKRCHWRFIEYKERTESGAHGLAVTLHYVQTTCESLVADLAAAAFAPAGLLAAGLAAAVAGGEVAAVATIATQVAEKNVYHTRRDYDVAQILGDAGESAVTNFVSALGSGFLARPFERVLGNILKYHVPAELWLDLANEGEHLTADQAMKHFAKWKPFCDFCGAEAAALLAGTVDHVIGHLRAIHRKDVDTETLMDTLERDLAANGLAQIFCVAFMRRLRWRRRRAA